MKPQSRATFVKGVICGDCGSPVQDDFWAVSTRGRLCYDCLAGPEEGRMARHDEAHQAHPVKGCVICQEKGWYPKHTGRSAASESVPRV